VPSVIVFVATHESKRLAIRVKEEPDEVFTELSTGNGRPFVLQQLGMREGGVYVNPATIAYWHDVD
jgi:hypothetical protein